MSTKIMEITGRYEESQNNNLTINYSDSDISLTRFSGGIKNGSMLQITISNNKESAYVQLTKSQVKYIMEILNESFIDQY